MPVLTATDLVCVRGARLVFAGLSFRLEPGGALLALGPNGSGKSSLLRLLAGLLRPAAGALDWDGRPVREEAEAHRRRVAYVGHRDAVKPTLSARDNLTFWAGLADPREARARADLALEALGLAALADLPARYLSSGQSRRLALARPLVTGGRLWLLDEPTVGLDREALGRLEGLLARHRDGGGMVALATHAPLALPGADMLDLAAHAASEDAA